MVGGPGICENCGARLVSSRQQLRIRVSVDTIYKFTRGYCTVKCLQENLSSLRKELESRYPSIDHLEQLVRESQGVASERASTGQS